jgi:membrane protease YdiL (CAAX protease family)
MRYTLFVLLTLILLAGIGWITYQTARLLRVWTPDSNLLLAPAENALRLGLIVLCIGLGLLSGLPPVVLGWTWDDAGAAIGWGVVAGVALSLLLTGASVLALRRWGQTIYSPLVVLNILPASRREWLLVLLALFPAVLLEELLFRSLLVGGLSPLAPAWLLVIGISLLFGLLHTPQGALGVAGTALAGLVLSLLFLWQGSLLAPLVAHYTANALQLVQASRSREQLAALQDDQPMTQDSPLISAAESTTISTTDKGDLPPR